MRLGGGLLTRVYLGSTAITRVYLGATEVWANNPSTPPVITATDSLFGRTWTLTASVTGNPAPSLALAFTVNGTPVTLTPTIAAGVRTWTYITPSSLNPVSLAATLTASSVTGTDVETFSRTVSADLIVPVVTADFALASYAAGDVINAASLTRAIPNPGAPALTDGALTSTLRVNGVTTALPYTCVAGVTLVHRVSYSHPATGATFVDSPSRVVTSSAFFINVDASNVMTYDLPPPGGEWQTTSPPHLARTNAILLSDFAAGPVILYGGEIQGTPTEGQTLSVLFDPWVQADNAITRGTPNWQSNGVDIPGATSLTFTIGPGRVGQAIRLRRPYTDANGTRNAFSNALTVVSTAPDWVFSGRIITSSPEPATPVITGRNITG